MEWMILFILGLFLIIAQISCLIASCNIDRHKKDSINKTFRTTKRLIGSLAFVFNIILYAIGFIIFFSGVIDISQLIIIFIVTLILGAIGIAIVFFNKKALPYASINNRNENDK